MADWPPYLIGMVVVECSGLIWVAGNVYQHQFRFLGIRPVYDRGDDLKLIDVAPEAVTFCRHADS